MIRSMMGKKKLQLFTKRFFPAGNYTWVVPRGCKEVDVFLVGGVVVEVAMLEVVDIPDLQI